MKIGSLWQILKQAAVAWSEDRSPTVGAALAYYTVFSLAPLLLIAISLASLVFGEEAARGGITDEIQNLLGPDTGKAVTSMLENAYRTGSSGGMTVIGLVTLLLGASGAFGQLQDAFNTIWKKEASQATGNWLIVFVRERLLTFAAVLGIGFLLLVSLIVNAVLAAMGGWVTNAGLPGGASLWHGVSMAASFAVITLMFGLLFKLLPNAPLTWRDVALGAVITAGLFTLGQYLIGLYLGRSSVASPYGAAGSLVVLLVWVYYSAQIFLFGAEFTHVFATTAGSQCPAKPA